MPEPDQPIVDHRKTNPGSGAPLPPLSIAAHSEQLYHARPQPIRYFASDQLPKIGTRQIAPAWFISVVDASLMSLMPSQAILFELLRSYVALAHTLNLSEAVAKLGSTRQTVRRHIQILEEARGQKLFEMRNRQYCLTDAGAHSLKEAEAILARAQAWLVGSTERVDGLAVVKNDGDEGLVFWAQQHRIARLWINESPLLQCGLRCWADANASIEAPEFRRIRPYLVIYRRHGDGWLCVEIGDESSYASWFGWAWAKSNVGRLVSEMPAGKAYARFVVEAYQSVYEGYSVRLDHIHAEMPRQKDGPLLPVSFQRLLLGCTFPDGEFALAMLVDRTYSIEIAGLSDERIRAMPKDLVMNVAPNTAGPKE